MAAFQRPMMTVAVMLCSQTHTCLPRTAIYQRPFLLSSFFLFRGLGTSTDFASSTVLPPPHSLQAAIELGGYFCHLSVTGSG